MAKIIQVKVGDYRGIVHLDRNSVECNRDEYVIVDIDKASEFGQVVSDPSNVCEGKSENTKGRIVRKATDGDLKQVANNRMKAKEALETCVRKINERKLDMNLIKAEYTFDSSKIIFFFTAEGRIDFRNLVKELARIFRVRIELKQIGVRDKAKIIGGFGVCGRELCCTSFLSDFHALSIKMAKEQGLPLNPSRISGVCGRIKCCMAYEFQVYKEFSKNLPHLGDQIQTNDGTGRVIDLNILKKIVFVDMGEGRIVKLDYTQKAHEK